MEELRELPAKTVVNSLFSFLYSLEEEVKWHAISALGLITADFAERDIEDARVIMRRLIWNLNDESGGIGWGSPEAMGEIMAHSRRLAEEYSKILVSYISLTKNFIENETLQNGVLWGIGRVANSFPDLVKEAEPLLKQFLNSKDLRKLILTLLSLKAIGSDIKIYSSKKLLSYPGKVKIYNNELFRDYSISEILR